MSIKNIKRPIILKRMIVKPPGNTNKNQTSDNIRSINHKLVKLSTIPLYREDVIFESKGEPFLPGEYRSITLVNKLNNLTNNCSTIARCITDDDEIIEKTSDNLIKLIGQEGYNTVFHALCSVINQEYRIKSILSLLTVLKEEKPEEVTSKNKALKTISFKVPAGIKFTCMGSKDVSCQTDETRIELKKKKVRRRVRKVLVPYVVKPHEMQLKKVLIDPYAITSLFTDKIKVNQDKTTGLNSSLVKTESILSEATSGTASERDKNSLPDLGYLHDDSNDSIKSFSTLHSFKTIPDLLINPISLVKSVDEHTKTEPTQPYHSIMLIDRSVVQVPFKPEDDFHIATKENLLNLNEVDRKKLLLHQMQIDFKFCLKPMDEDGNLPIHLAVINDDLELLKRHCVVLKIRNQSLDMLASNGLTALKLSIFRESPSATSVLLEHGADPFLSDAEHSTCVHLAAELRTDHLPVILHHCKMNARSIIMQHAEELQTPEWQSKSDEELGNLVLHHFCTLFDKKGYTPLMLASKLGHYENVRLLLESDPGSVQLTMPTSGNTALFLGVAAACTVAAERGNKSKVVDHFRKTIEILLEHRADPFIDNHSGTNVNLLLQEFNCTELSMLVANKITCMKYFKGDEDCTKNFDKYILMKEGNTVSIQDIDFTEKTILNNTVKKKEEQKNKIEIKEEIPDERVNDVKKEIDASKPVITENILIKSPVAVQTNTTNTNAKMNRLFLIKPSLKMKTVSSVKKVIWKRKTEDDGDVIKRPKNT